MTGLSYPVEVDNASYRTGALLRTHELKPGSYHVQQINNRDSLRALNGFSGKDRIQLQGTVGVVSISGSINALTLDAVIEVDVAGIHLGSFGGNPERAFKISIDLHFAKGTVQLTTRGDEVWLHTDVDVVRLDDDNKAQSTRCVESIPLRTLPEVRCEPWWPV